MYQDTIEGKNEDKNSNRPITADNDAEKSGVQQEENAKEDLEEGKEEEEEEGEDKEAYSSIDKSRNIDQLNKSTQSIDMGDQAYKYDLEVSCSDTRNKQIIIDNFEHNFKLSYCPSQLIQGELMIIQMSEDEDDPDQVIVKDYGR